MKSYLNENLIIACWATKEPQVRQLPICSVIYIHSTAQQNKNPRIVDSDDERPSR